MKYIKIRSLVALFFLLSSTLLIPLSVNADESIYPAAINGYPVIFVQTPENTPYLPDNKIILNVLDISAKTVEESIAPSSIQSYLETHKLPKGWIIELIGGQDSTLDNFERMRKEYLETYKKAGPFILGFPNLEKDKISRDTASFAIVGNNDPQIQTIKGQTARWYAPTVGSLGNRYCALMNNGTTNSHNWFLQLGQIYWSGGSYNAWATTDTNYEAQPFSVPYIVGHRYEFWIRNYGVWTLECQDLTSGSYSIVYLDDFPGTKLIKNNGTSIFFENYNTNTNWYQGFSNPISVSYCRDYTTRWKAWNGQYIVIIDASGAVVPNDGIITGSLVNYGIASWHLEKVLLGQ